MRLETDFTKLTRQALDIIEICRVSQGSRAAAYRAYAQWIETGRASGDLAVANQLYGFLQRLSSHLYSPTELRFNVGSKMFRNNKEWLKKLDVTGRELSEEWENQDIDIEFGLGVNEALAYGACILKQNGEETIEKDDNGEQRRTINVTGSLVMPWQFGVYNEGENSLHKQEAVVETVMLTKAEIWRRVRNLPDARKLYRRILASSSQEQGTGVSSSFMHQVLSTAILDTNLANATRPIPGGIVQLSNSPNTGTLGPLVGAELYPMHQLWVKDDERDDYTTIQICEPDIMIAPYNNGRVVTKKVNLFCPGALPYSLIQPNVVSKYFWGRSEIVDLMKLQELLTGSLDELKRIVKLFCDKLLGVEGFEGDMLELQASLRTTGMIGLPQGAKLNDLTPQFPADLIKFCEFVLQLMERTSGFSNILSGSGEPGVRAAVHADTLLRTASPRLRDRSLVVERQCAKAGDVTLVYLQAKDATVFWTDDSAESEFMLSQLPSDRKVSVDSHSTSPIYHDDAANLMSFGIKAGFIGGDSAIEQMPYNHKDVLLARLKEKEEKQAALLAEIKKIDPELFARMISGGGGHHASKRAA